MKRKELHKITATGLLCTVGGLLFLSGMAMLVASAVMYYRNVKGVEKLHDAVSGRYGVDISQTCGEVTP